MPKFQKEKSFWSEHSPCDKTCKSEGGRAGGTQLWLLKKKSRLCGVAEQQQGFSPYRRPMVWFYGNLEGAGYKVTYTDSFSSDESSTGQAYVWLENELIQWETIHEPQDEHYAYLDNIQLKRKTDLKTSNLELSLLTDCIKNPK